MKRASRFSFSKNWLVLLKDMNVEIADLLSAAGLPHGLFSRETVTLSITDYFKFWRGIEKVIGDENLALLLSANLTTEAFDPAIFASLCSPNLNVALKRIRDYKPLIGPMELKITESEAHTSLEVSCYGFEGGLPQTLGVAEAAFFTKLARLATRTEIKPQSVQLNELPSDLLAHENFFGCELKKGDSVQICFSAEDAQRPFLTANTAMWEFFEGSLKQRLKDLNSDASAVDRVSAVLVELLPAGEVTIDQVASRLAMSKRTLQRRLTEEAETFQSVLQRVRVDLADHYLEKSHLSLGEISFMLGFQEPNSFIRAYSTWRGVSPGQYREKVRFELDEARKH